MDVTFSGVEMGRDFALFGADAAKSSAEIATLASPTSSTAQVAASVTFSVIVSLAYCVANAVVSAEDFAASAPNNTKSRPISAPH